MEHPSQSLRWLSRCAKLWNKLLYQPQPNPSSVRPDRPPCILGLNSRVRTSISTGSNLGSPLSLPVFRAKYSEMKWVVNKGSGNDDGDGGGFGGEAAESVVRLRGLPYDCSKDDIKKFFDGERQFQIGNGSVSDCKLSFQKVVTSLQSIYKLKAHQSYYQRFKVFTDYSRLRSSGTPGTHPDAGPRLL